MTPDPIYVPTPFDALAAKVDVLFANDRHVVGEIAAAAMERLVKAHETESVTPKRDIYVLQLNALSTLAGAIELWRRGLLVQVGILLRNACEALATAAVLNADKDAYDRYVRGDRESSKSLTKVKLLWPQVEEALSRGYGFLSRDSVRRESSVSTPCEEGRN